MGEPYKITIKHTPGTSQPWSYVVFQGVMKLDSGSTASRSEAIDRAKRGLRMTTPRTRERNSLTDTAPS